MLQLLTLAVCVGVAAASYGNNLNYRSPSYYHPALGVSIYKVNKRSAGSPPYDASKLNFTHGVASGDPYPHSVILWTRCAPMKDDVDDNSTVSGYVPVYNPVPTYEGDEKHPPPSTAPVCLSFKVTKDKALKDVVDSGVAYTSSDVDYTLKVRRPALRCLSHSNPRGARRSKRRNSSPTRNITISSPSATRILKARLVARNRRPRLMI